MSVKSYFLIPFLGLFMHAYACNARYIGVTDSDFLKKFHANKIEEKRILGMDSIQDIRHINARRLASRIPSNSISPNSGKTEDLHKGKKGYREAKSGSGIFESSPHKGLLNAAKFEDSRQQVLVDHKEKISDSTIVIEQEDKILDTDYQPPHRKTPIHNK